MPPSKDFALGGATRRRRPSLTPMIDVVFLLLVFFMLAARFGQDQSIPLSPALAGAGTYQGAPRLVTVAEGGQVRLNGRPVVLADLAAELRPLMPDAAAIVVLRPTGDAKLQDLVTVMDDLTGAGIQQIVLAE